MSITIVAEAGVAHGGDLDTAKKLATAAKSCGADIVKFQTYLPFELMRPSDPDFELLSKLTLPRDDFVKLAKWCEDIGIEFMTTPGELTSLKFAVEELGVKRIKLGSDDLTNSRLQWAARQTNLPKIQSTGMGTMPEIWDAIGALGSDNLTLLHCVSNYPCKMEHANLEAMNTIKNEMYKKGFAKINVGYSDHTAMSSVVACAAAMGASMIEAHFMLGYGPTPVDEAVSYDYAAFRHLVQMIRNVEKMQGTGVIEPNEDELKLIPKVRKGSDGKRGLI